MMDMAAAAEVGVRSASGRTRGRDVAEEDEATTTAATPTVKRRKLEEEEDGESEIKSSVRDLAEPPETCSVEVGRSSWDGDECERRNVGEASLSCCSSNGTIEKEDTGTARHCSSSSTTRREAVGECWKVKEEEVEEFFMAAEKDLRNTLLIESCRKYNFDFVKEEALEGRYEWLKFNP